MLRRPQSANIASELSIAATESGCAFPRGDEAYCKSDRPFGIRFYIAGTSFYLPYQLLQAMNFQQTELTLCFASDDVVITGDRLHEVYVHIADHAVCRIVQQGARYSSVTENGPVIIKIVRSPRG